MCKSKNTVLSFIGGLVLAPVLVAQNVVVWDFATRDGAKDRVTASLTYEFEEALAKQDSYTVVERRKLDRLQSVIKNEKALYDIGDISLEAANELKGLGVQMVVFGEVFDDIDSGEVSITITFQSLQGRKEIIQSILMRRGLILDSDSRRKKMVELVQLIHLPSHSGAMPTEDDLNEEANDAVRITDYNNVSVEVQRCLAKQDADCAIAKLKAFRRKYPGSSQAEEAAGIIDEIKKK